MRCVLLLRLSQYPIKLRRWLYREKRLEPRVPSTSVETRLRMTNAHNEHGPACYVVLPDVERLITQDGFTVRRSEGRHLGP